HRPGRVIAAHRGGDLVATARGELLAQATGRLRHLAGPAVAGLPAVGDWVAVRGGRIHAVLPRRTAVTRRTPGSNAGEQVLVATGEVRDDGKGRHTTSTRQLVVLAGGGLVIDTPGLRELGLWTSGAGTAAAFDDVEALAGACRFDDCRHRTEPGCAVLEALE